VKIERTPTYIRFISRFGFIQFNLDTRSRKKRRSEKEVCRIISNAYLLTSEDKRDVVGYITALLDRERF